MFIKKIISAFLFGKGVKVFLNKNYESSIDYFEKIIRLDPENGQKGYARYYLSISYLYTGNHHRAKEEMDLAYDIIRRKVVDYKEESAVKYFKALSKEYMRLLSLLKDKKKLQIIEEDLKKVMNERGTSV